MFLRRLKGFRGGSSVLFYEQFCGRYLNVTGGDASDDIDTGGEIGRELEAEGLGGLGGFEFFCLDEGAADVVEADGADVR